MCMRTVMFNFNRTRLAEARFVMCLGKLKRIVKLFDVIFAWILSNKWTLSDLHACRCSRSVTMQIWNVIEQGHGSFSFDIASPRRDR